MATRSSVLGPFGRWGLIIRLHAVMIVRGLVAPMLRCTSMHLVAFTLIVSACWQLAAASQPLTLLRGGRVWTPEALGVKDVLIGGSQVLALLEPSGTAAAALLHAYAAGDHPLIDVIDVHDADVLPGFVDVHVHVTGVRAARVLPAP